MTETPASTPAPAPPGGDDTETWPGMTTPCPKCGGARSVNYKGEWSCYGECGGYGTLPGGDDGAAAGEVLEAAVEAFDRATVLPRTFDGDWNLIHAGLTAAQPILTAAALAEAARARAEVERLTGLVRQYEGGLNLTDDEMDAVALRAESARLAATLGRVEGLLDDPDDPFTHMRGCEAAYLGRGDPDCGACWTAKIRAAAAGTDETGGDL